jgi:tetratricopeptide (TPR) repeat protein
MTLPPLAGFVQAANALAAAPASGGRKRVNLKAVLILLVASGALTGTVWLVHAIQLERNAREVYEQALQAEREGQPEREQEYLKAYIALVPTNTDARAKYVLLLKKQAKTLGEHKRAYWAMANLLLSAPARQDVRREFVTLGMQLGQYSEAKEQLAMLREDDPGDGELVLLAARCERGLGQYDRARELYDKAIAARPDQTDAYLELADLLRRDLQEPHKADDTVRQMVTANPRSARALLAAAGYFSATGSFKGGQYYLGLLLDGRPPLALEDLPEKGAEAYLLAGEVFQEGEAFPPGKAEDERKKAQAKARGYLEAGAKRYPDDSRFERRLARLELAGDRSDKGRADKARAYLTRSLEDLPTQPEELADLGNLLLDLGDLDAVPRVIDHFPKKDADPLAGYLRARLLVSKQAWGEARAQLEKVRGARLPPDVDKRVNLLLAECYRQLENPDQQLAAARRALAIDPLFLPARALAASALAALGKLEVAIAEYDLIVAAAPESREERVRLMLLRNRRLPPASRRWLDVEGALNALPEDRQKAPEVRLLRAEALADWADSCEGKEREDKRDQARRIAEAERRRDPKAPGPWLLLASLAERAGEGDKVLALLDDAEKEAGRRAEWALARAAHWVGSPAPDAVEQLRRIERSLDQYPDEAQGRLVSGLAAAFAFRGELADAERLWAQVARRRPNDLDVRYLLFERAQEAGRDDDVERLLGELKGIEGEGGPVAAYAEAVRQVARADKGDKGALGAARRALAVAAAARPTWSRVPLLEARILEREGRPDKAVEKYREAIDRGDRRPAVVQRAAQLLYEQGSGAEANDLLRALPEEVAGSPLLAPLAGRLSLLADDQEGGVGGSGTKRALQLARTAAAHDPKNYRAQMWLGQVARVAGEPKEAEAAFRKARDLKDDVPETWEALLLFLADTRPEDAKKEMAEAARRLPKDQAPIALVPCYEALKQPAEAAAQCQAALDARPGDPHVLHLVATFNLRYNETAKAESLLRKLTDPDIKAPPALAAEARRELALLVVQRGGQARLREALALVDENLKVGGGTVFDRRARGLVLATRPFHRKDAITLLEETTSDAITTPPQPQFILAQLYEADGNGRRAEAQMLALLRRHDKNPAYLAYHVRLLLAHGNTDAAQVWLDRLKKVSDGPETIELQARLLRVKGDEKEAVRLLTSLAGKKDVRLDLLGRVLEEFGATAEAEKAFRDYAAASKDPHAVLSLALYLARHKQLAEALTLCEKAWATCRPEAVAAAAVAVARAAEATEEQRQRVAGWITAAAGKQPDKAAPLLEALAEFEELRGRSAESEQLYRKVLRQEPDSAVALNNLAYLLALRGGHDAEALELADKAIDNLGPVPDFLDTRGVVHLKGDRPAPAIKDLQQAIQVSASPVRYFHLAQARLAAGNKAEAAEAWQQATRKVKETDPGLQETDLHPLERAAFRELVEQLKPKG